MPPFLSASHADLQAGRRRGMFSVVKRSLAILIIALRFLVSENTYSAELDSYSQNLSQLGSGFFQPQSRPSSPLPNLRPAAEWDLAEALWINLSLPTIRHDDQALAFFRDLIKIASEYVPVIVGCDFETAESWGKLKEEILPYSPSQPIYLFDSQCNSYWTRDYGPSFAFDQSGQLIFIDSIYRGVQSEIELFSNSLSQSIPYEQKRNTQLYQVYRNNGRRAEIAPLHLARFARQALNVSIDCVRPPIHMHGGDYVSDGNSRVYLSQDTLIANGGQLAWLQSIMASYFGAKELLILEAPPGNVVKHLDLNAKLLRPDFMLLAGAPKISVSSSRYARKLAQTATRILEANRDYLSQHAPDLRLFDLPTPSIAEESKEQTLLTIASQVVQAACLELGVNFDSYWYEFEPGPEYPIVKEKVDTRLKQVVGHSARLLDESDLNALALHYLKSSLDTLLESNVESSTRYRTYTNSLLINTPDHGMVILLPRYGPEKQDSAHEIASMETDVERIYRIAYPKAIIHWIDVDPIYRLGGALHCLGMVIPRSSPRNSPRS